MSENAKYWIWLQNVFGYGAKISKIIDEFGGAKELYNLVSYTHLTLPTTPYV